MSIEASALRMLVLYRGDLLEMTRGKSEVQFGHAIASTLVLAMEQDNALVVRYFADNQPT